MGEFYINDTSLDMSHDYGKQYNEALSIINVVTWIIICIGLPLTLVAIYALCSLVRKDNVAPIYVINLLISDLIQFCCMIGFVEQPEDHNKTSTIFTIYYSGLMASVGFMVCIALERYLVIACPLWYRFRRTIKISVVVCVLVWIISLVYCFSSLFWNTPNLSVIIYCIFFLLPLPLLIFFLVRTLKVLSASISVHADEK